MELDWTTFLLEIVNFIVLIWILQRFFYKPVQDVIARRKAAIDASVSRAKAAQEEADRLKGEYQKRLEDWSEERARAREQLAKDLDEERARGLEALQTALDKEREKNKTLEQRRVDELGKVLKEKAVGRGADFATKLVSRFSGPELENKLIAALCDDMTKLPSEQTRSIRSAFRGDAKPRIVVASAFAVEPASRELLRARLSELAGRDVAVEFAADPSLLCGVRVDLSSWVLRANLRDELGFFAEAELDAA